MYYGEKLYKYEGCVSSENYVLDRHWSGYTRAVSDKKAMCNLSCQFKRQNGMPINSKIYLDGTLVEV